MLAIQPKMRVTIIYEVLIRRIRNYAEIVGSAGEGSSSTSSF